MRRRLLAAAILLVASCGDSTPPASERLIRSHRALDYLGERHLFHWGGATVLNAKIYSVFWGNAGFTPAVRSGLSQFYGELVTSNYVDWLNEYAVTGFIGRGSFGGEYVIAPGTTDAGVFSVGDELVRQIAAGSLPSPDANAIYAVTLPPQLAGSFCFDGWCEDHWATYYNGVPVRYFVVAEQGWDSATLSGSAGVAELITNPLGAGDNFTGWENDYSADIMVLCNGSGRWYQGPSGRVYRVANLWSNAVNDCVGPPMSVSYNGGQLTSGSSTQFLVHNLTSRDLRFELGTLSPGVSGTFSNSGAVPPGNSATLTLSPASGNLPPGDSYFTAFGKDPSTNALLARARGDYSVRTLYLTNPSLAVTIGGPPVVTLVQNGLGLIASLQAIVPAGVSASFSTNPLPSGQYSWLTLSAGTGAAAGPSSYRVTDGYSNAFGSLTITCPSGTAWCAGSHACLGSGQVCPPTCGDGSCSGGESCESCAADCGACEPPPSHDCPAGKSDCCGDGVCRTRVLCRNLGC